MFQPNDPYQTQLKRALLATMEQLKNKNHLTPGLAVVLATRASTLDMATATQLAVKVAIPVPPVVAVVMTVMAMTADVLPTRASILYSTATTRLAVKMTIPETPVLAGGHDGGVGIMTVTVVMTVTGMMGACSGRNLTRMCTRFFCRVGDDHRTNLRTQIT
jgi:hypothetical protein